MGRIRSINISPRMGVKPFLSAFLFIVILILTHSVFAQDPQDNSAKAIALFQKGQDLHEKGDLNDAIKAYKEALQLFPEFPEAELQLGKAYLSVNKHDEAEAALRRAYQLREDWSLAAATLGSILLHRGKFEEARPILKKAIDLDANNTPAWASTASLAIATGAQRSELQQILKSISLMAESANPSAMIWSAKASLEFALGDKKAASVSASRTVAIDPNDISMLALLANASIDAKDTVKATELAEKIEALDPRSNELTFIKVRILAEDGKFDDAIRTIDSVKQPTKELLAIRSQIVAASTTDVPSLEKQLDADPRNIVALGKLCNLLRTTDAQRAIEYCRRASSIEPNNIDHVIGYGAALLYTKQYAAAAELFQKLTALAPENYSVRANFATALFQLKRYNEAKGQFTWLTEKQPTNAAAYFFLAVSHDELREYPDAMANYQLFMKFADPKVNQLEIDKVNLRLPTLQKQLRSWKGKPNGKGKS